MKISMLEFILCEFPWLFHALYVYFDLYAGFSGILEINLVKVGIMSKKIDTVDLFTLIM